MNSELVTMAPAMDALTSRYSPASKAVMAINELRQIPERRVQQPADGTPGLLCDGFGRVTQEACERNDGNHRQDEEQRLRCSALPPRSRPRIGNISAIPHLAHDK